MRRSSKRDRRAGEPERGERRWRDDDGHGDPQGNAAHDPDSDVAIAQAEWAAHALVSAAPEEAEPLPRYLDGASLVRASDRARFLVYADELQLRGELAGELVAVQVALEECERGATRAVLERRSDELRRARFGWSAALEALGVQLSWRRGFVDQVSFDLGGDDLGWLLSPLKAMGFVARQPALRRVRAVRVHAGRLDRPSRRPHHPGRAAPLPPSTLADALGAEKWPSVEELHIECRDGEHHLGAELWRAFPNLRALHLRERRAEESWAQPRIVLPPAEAPAAALRRCSLHCHGAGALLAAIEPGALEALSVAVGEGDDGRIAETVARSNLDRLRRVEAFGSLVRTAASLLVPAHAPALRYLDLSLLDDDSARVLTRYSRALERLSVVRIRDVHGDDGELADALRDAARRAPHLTVTYRSPHRHFVIRRSGARSRGQP
jgi:hypothetical protein